MIFKRNTDSFGYRVKLISVKLRKKYSRKCNCVHNRVFLVNTHHLLCLRFDKARIKISVVCDKDCSFTEFYEFRKHFLYRLCIDNHGIIYSCQLLNPERNWNLRIYKARKTVNTSSVLILYCSNLNDSVML